MTGPNRCRRRPRAECPIRARQGTSPSAWSSADAAGIASAAGVGRGRRREQRDAGVDQSHERQNSGDDAQEHPPRAAR